MPRYTILDGSDEVIATVDAPEWRAWLDIAQAVADHFDVPVDEINHMVEIKTGNSLLFVSGELSAYISNR